MKYRHSNWVKVSDLSIPISSILIRMESGIQYKSVSCPCISMDKQAKRNDKAAILFINQFVFVNKVIM